MSNLLLPDKDPVWHIRNALIIQPQPKPLLLATKNPYYWLTYQIRSEEADDWLVVLIAETSFDWKTDLKDNRLRLVVNRRRLAPLLKEDISPAQASQLMQILIWKISLEWLKKLKHDPSYRFKSPLCLSRPLKPWGILLCSALNITKELVADKHYKPSLSALEAFAPVATELYSLCFDSPDGGKEKVKKIRDINMALKCNEQPFESLRCSITALASASLCLSSSRLALSASASSSACWYSSIEGAIASIAELSTASAASVVE